MKDLYHFKLFVNYLFQTVNFFKLYDVVQMKPYKVFSATIWTYFVLMNLLKVLALCYLHYFCLCFS